MFEGDDRCLLHLTGLTDGTTPPMRQGKMAMYLDVRLMTVWLHRGTHGQDLCASGEVSSRDGETAVDDAREQWTS